MNYRMEYISCGWKKRIFCSTEDFITKMHFVDAGRAICILTGCCLRIVRRISPKLGGRFPVRKHKKSPQLSEAQKLRGREKVV